MCKNTNFIKIPFSDEIQSCCVSSLCRDQSLGPSIPSPLLKTPLRELCTNAANSVLETHLLCLLINIYPDIYQENMKGKSSICISTITRRGISLNTLGHRHRRAAARSPQNLLGQICLFRPLQIKGETLVYSGGHGASAGRRRSPALQSGRLFRPRKSKTMNSDPCREKPAWGGPGVPPPGTGGLHQHTHRCLQPFLFPKNVLLGIFFLTVGELLVSDLCQPARDEGWSARHCTTLLYLPILWGVTGKL